MRGSAYSKKAATRQQIAKVRGLKEQGLYDGSLSIIYSYDEAERIIARYTPRELVTGWEKGQGLLDAGYVVEYGQRDFCFRVSRPRPVDNPDGPTTAYNVYLGPYKTFPRCDCPDATNHSHNENHVCKHALAARVQVWLWAQESEGDFSEYLELCGITALRAGFRGPAATDNTISAGEQPALFQEGLF
jgi:hypothetical protein